MRLILMRLILSNPIYLHLQVKCAPVSYTHLSVGIDEFDSLDYIAVMGDITSFQGNLQLHVKRVRRVQEGEYDPKDYLPVSDKAVSYTHLLVCRLCRQVHCRVSKSGSDKC